MERLFWTLSPPRWPRDQLPIIEGDFSLSTDAILEEGRLLYLEHCASCHSPESDSELYEPKMFTLNEIGTDSVYFSQMRESIRYYDFPSGSYVNKDPAEAIEDFTSRMRSSLQQQTGFDNPDFGRPPGWRNSFEELEQKEVAAKPLDGIWSTAPFLHNGSILSLRELLMPASARTKVFYTGSREYDMQNLGLVKITDANRSDFPKATFRFDTTKPGNSNAGHEFAVNLSETQKNRLLHYLKIHGEGAPRIKR